MTPGWATGMWRLRRAAGHPFRGEPCCFSGAEALVDVKCLSQSIVSSAGVAYLRGALADSLQSRLLGGVARS